MKKSTKTKVESKKKKKVKASAIRDLGSKKAVKGGGMPAKDCDPRST